MKTSTLLKSISGMALASVFLLSGCQKEALLEEQFQNQMPVTNGQHGQPIPDQYIIVFKNGNNNLSATGINSLHIADRSATNMLRERLIQAAGIESASINQSFDGAVTGFAAKLTKHQLQLLRQDPDIAYIEQDRIISLSKPSTTGPGNANTHAAFGLSKNNRSKDKDKSSTTPEITEPVEPGLIEPAPVEPAPAEQEKSTYTKIIPLQGETLPWHISMTGFGDGSGKTVWVIDSGIDTDHPDLNIDLGRSLSFIYGNASIEDGFGHGTNVAGVIAAKNNGSGMVGVAANATVVALRVFDDAGYGTISRAIGAVNHLINNAKAGDVANMSLGASISSTLDDAVKTAANKGILFAIAAGNSGSDCSMNSPARVDVPGVYTVSAMDRYHSFWSSSNYGAPVDFAAPGVGITVTRIGGGIGGGATGTSFAAPHVAGILLLRGTVFSQGIVNGDKDSWPDPIASVE